MERSTLVIDILLLAVSSHTVFSITNVALATSGASCKASEEMYSSSCSLAIDGIFDDTRSRWSTETLEAEPDLVGWIEITFDDVYRLISGRIMEKPHFDDSLKDVMLTFSGGQTQMIVMSPHNGSTPFDESGLWWDEFDIIPTCTSSLRITALSVYEFVSPGTYMSFLEVELYSDEMHQEWRLWGHVDDELGERLQATDNPCGCVALTEPDLRKDLLFIVETPNPFWELNFTLQSTGMSVDYPIPCDGSILPATVMTTDASLGRLANGTCQPTCGPVIRCDYVPTPGYAHHFKCTCSASQCQDIGIFITTRALIFDKKTMTICTPVLNI